MKKKIVFMISAALLFQACTYAISPDLAKQADKNISFASLENDPESHKGKLVILGGTISRTYTVRQVTVIEVIQKSLDYWGRPMRTKQSGGTFMVIARRSLDPLVYAPGREITVAGEVEGLRSSELGETEYAYPILVSKELKLWERIQPSLERPQYLDPLYNPYTSPREY